MWPETANAANDPHAPGTIAERTGCGRDPKARLEQLMVDRRMQRILRDEGQPRDLMLRMARAVRRGAAETPAQP